MIDTIGFAKAYAGKGWQSFPCREKDKTPLVKWADLATTEENMLVGWWDNYPLANIGIACGKRSGIVVIDVDKEHGGYESMTELILKYGALPETPVSKTGSGGEHIFFKHPGIEIRNSAGKLGKGIDVRGDGGYVVAPPSTHPNGHIYEWVVKPSQNQLAEMPEWMIELIKEKQQERVEIPKEGAFPQGQRHYILVSMAGAMRRKGMGTESIFQALWAENLARCDPPAPEINIRRIAESMERYEPQDEIKIQKPLPTAWDVIDELEAEIIERQKNPRDVWGIHYAWPYLSLITGGKQRGELIILAGEPGVGKSWWAHQDALYTALGDPCKKIESTPVLLWSGEMSKKQVHRRFFEMLGIQKRHMLTGNMSQEDWQKFNEAKALIVNSPIHVSDSPLDLKNVRGLLEREMGEHGIRQVVFDYDWLISAPGGNEIEQSQNISRLMKQLARELDLSIILISSVNKTGMDTLSENVTKSNVSGSGKKLHDADVIYIATKFNEKKNNNLNIKPCDYSKITTIHIAKGRELDYHIPGGAVNYMRETPNPRFKELKDIGKKDAIPEWVSRKDIT
ncbi:MAG: bifunctional DNA primase/polymerase [Candidatus Berkelbacteria bacterium]|nr:bifunctional DNA primase/polymerase [Candidatus Berkelbacteria bacterium]